jgi:DNA polymerase III sliding clamp (beta) subunit (PCNA family)
MIKIDNRILTEWEQVPNVWKKYPVRKVVNQVFQNIENEEFENTFEPFTYDVDYFRPAMSGVNVDEDCIVATNANIILIYPNRGKIENGIYNFKEKNGIKKYTKIDAIYPNYKYVIPEETTLQYRITILTLRTYLQVLISGQYFNKDTNHVNLKVDGKEDNICAVNAKYLCLVLDTFQSFGYEYIYFGFNERKGAGIIISNDEYNVTNPYKAMKNGEALCLLMPLENYNIEFGSIEVDYKTECKIYFDFKKDAIVEKYGDLYNPNAYWRPNAKRPLPYNLTEDNITQLSNITKTNKVLMYANVFVELNVLYARSLMYDCMIVIKSVDIEDGEFEIINGALKNVDNPQLVYNDFRYKLTSNSNYSRSNPTKFELNTKEFLEAYSEAVICKLTNKDTSIEYPIQFYSEYANYFISLQYGNYYTDNYIFYNKNLILQGGHLDLKYSIPESVYAQSILKYFDTSEVITIYTGITSIDFEIGNTYFVIFKEDEQYKDINILSNNKHDEFENLLDEFTKDDINRLKDCVAANIKFNKKNKYNDKVNYVGYENKSFSRLSFAAFTSENGYFSWDYSLFSKNYKQANNIFRPKLNIDFIAIHIKDDTDDIFTFKNSVIKAFFDITKGKNIYFNDRYMIANIGYVPVPPTPKKTPKQKKQKVIPTPTIPTPKVLTKSDYERRIKGLELLVKNTTDQSELDKFNRKLKGLKLLLKNF